MSESWTWSYADRDGAAVTDAPATETSFPTQSDAENWFGETWRDLLEAGVAEVSLFRDGVLVYGPMSLEPAP